jgi:hypothetical protein
MKEPSRQRGCEGKTNLEGYYKEASEKFAKIHNKTYHVYRCPHCEGTHMTTKPLEDGAYKSVFYTTTGE